MSDQVLFRLKLEPDQEAPAVLDKFVSDAKSADAQITESAISRTRQISSTFRGGVDDQIRASSRLSDHQEREAVKAGETQRREFEKTLKAHQDATRQMEENQKTFADSTREVNDRLIEAGQGLIQFGTGLAEIGIASEETAEAVVRGLVRIKGGIDVFEGLVKAYRALTSLTEVYSTAASAAAAVTQAAAKANAIAVHAEAAAWDHLALSRAGAAAAGGTAAGAGAATRAAGGAATAGGIGLTLGAIGAKIGGGLKAGAAYLGSAAGAAAAATVGIGTAVGIEVLDRFGRAPGDDREAGFMGLFNARREASESGKEVDDAQRRRMAQLEATARTELRAGAESRLLFRGGQAREAALDERIGLANPADQARLLKEAFSEALKARDAASSLSAADVPKATRAAAADEAGRLTERLKDLAQQRLVTEQKILDTAKRASEERKRAAEDELRLVKDRVKVEEDRLKTAAERFGGMSEKDQAAARAAIVQARRFGEDTLDRDQAALLSSIGTTAATRAAEASNLRRAQEAGFNRYFGEDERDAIRQGQSEARALELQVKTEQNIQAKIEMDEAAVVRQTAATVVKLVQEQETRLAKKIEDEVRKLKREIASRTRDQLVGAAATLGGT